MDALVFNTLAAVAAEQDADKRALLMARSNAALGEHFMRHPGDMEEVAYDLLNNAWSDAMSSDITRKVIEVKTVGLGDPDYVDEDLRGLRAYWQGKGGQILSDILRYERSMMPREEMVTAIDLHRDEITLDFWGSFSKLQGQAQREADAASRLPAGRTDPGRDHGGVHLRIVRRCDADRRAVRPGAGDRRQPLEGQHLHPRRAPGDTRAGQHRTGVRRRASRTRSSVPARSACTRATRSSRSRTSRTSRATSCCPRTNSGSSARTPVA